MRRNDERALYGLADDDDRPDPTEARNAAEFVALLGALVEHSGMSLLEIEELAASKGYVLPEQIIATALSHDALPPEELVVALVRCIGINDREVKYWVEVLWRLESRTTYNPAQANQEHERKAPRDIEEIYGSKDEPAPSEPFVVPAPYDVGQVPGAGEAHEEPYAAPTFLTIGQVPEADDSFHHPQSYGALRRPMVGEVYEPDSRPGEPPFGVAPGYETVEHVKPRVEAEPVNPAASRGFAEGLQAHAVQERGQRGSWTGMHRRHDYDDDDGGHPDDAQLMQRYEARDTWEVRPDRPRMRPLGTWSGGRGKEKAKWPLPVAVGLSILLAFSAVAWIALGNGGGGVSPNPAGAQPGNTKNQASTSSEATGGSVSPAITEGTLPTGEVEVVPGTGGNPPAGPHHPNPQPTTQGPQPTQTQSRPYNTQLIGTGSTTCTNEGGQWRVRIQVNVTVNDPPPGLNPQGQAGLSGSMQGFSLSGGGSSYSGSATVSVGSSSSPNVGTVQWVVTMSVPGGRIARDESFEGFSCA